MKLGGRRRGGYTVCPRPAVPASVPASLPQLGVALLPASEPRLVRAAEAAGLRVATGPELAELAVVDTTHPDGTRLLQALARSALGVRLSLVALATPDALPVLEPLRLADVLPAHGTEDELAYRLRRVAQRHHEREETLQRQRDLALLLELTADYAESLDVEALLHDVTRKLAREMDIARASLVVLDPHADAGVVVAASDDPGLKDLRIELVRYPEIREVVRTGRPVIVEDAPGHPLLEGVGKELAARGIQAIAALPLAIRGEVLGVLLLRASGARRTFSTREIDFLATVAHATAVALRNATLVQAVRGETQQEKRARIAAEERAASLERYHHFFANLREGVAILDREARVLSLNPAGALLLGVGAEAARGRHVLEVAPTPDEAPLMDQVARASAGAPQPETDVALRAPGGGVLTLSVTAAPLEGEGGGATLLSFRDVTTSRRLEGELRHTKDFLEQLIDGSVDAIIAADLSGRIILFNKGAEQVCGYTAQEAMQSVNVRKLYPAGVARHLMQRLRAGKGRLGAQRQEIVTRSGERVPVNMTASILYEGGREVATVGIFTDLRDRMRLERQLSDAEMRLLESEKNAVIVALAGTAAHELNQPLTSVMGYAELLKRKLKADDPSYRPVDIIHREAERMAEIVRKIGKITRYETKTYVGAQQILDLDKASSHEE